MAMLFERSGMWTCELTARGIFFVHIQCVPSIPLLDEFMAEARPHLLRLQPVLYLNDATELQDAPLTLQWRLAQHMKENAPYIARSAVFGLTAPKAFVVRSIIRASGRANIKIFDERAACEEWLLSTSDAQPLSRAS